MRVQDFCLKKTQAKELCVFRDQGWIVGDFCTMIDSKRLSGNYEGTEIIVKIEED